MDFQAIKSAIDIQTETGRIMAQVVVSSVVSRQVV